LFLFQFVFDFVWEVVDWSDGFEWICSLWFGKKGKGLRSFFLLKIFLCDISELCFVIFSLLKIFSFLLKFWFQFIE
jgi:hypothetical protein